MDFIFYGCWAILSLVSVTHLLIIKREPSSTIAWMVFVTAIPIVGALVFLVFGPQRLVRNASKRRRDIERWLRRKAATLPGSELPGNKIAPENFEGELYSKDAEYSQILRLARRVSEYGVTADNDLTFLSDPVAALREMKAAVDRAEKFIHLEYYIIALDDVTADLFDRLVAAAKRGVEVRILYDALGSLNLKRIFLGRLTRQGVKTAGFLPFTLFPQRINVNFRNHRKILIVDGKEAFTGGTNLGREYLGRKFAKQMRDFSVRLEGSACRQLQDVFAKDWHFTTNEDLFDPKYYPATAKSPAGNSSVQVLESGPDTEFQALHQVIFLAISSAKSEILLSTPYFIPDPAILTALVVASLRGVRVRILLPKKSDHRLVRYASRSFYDTVLKAGAEIYEYKPRMLHAKLLVIDGKWTVLGSGNMDIRSFKLNFELNLMIYGKKFTDQAVALFSTDLADSQRIDLGRFLNRPLRERMLENTCRLFSPVL